MEETMINIEYFNNSPHHIKSDNICIPFIPENFGFFVETDEKKKVKVTKDDDGIFTGNYDKLLFSYSFEEHNEYLVVNICIQNKGDDFFGKITFGTGIDSYMESYPQWNDKFFPTLLRCEKTHIWGYYMNTNEKSLAIASKNPIASYDINYNKFFEDDVWHCGHRIEGTELVLFADISLPERYPHNLRFLKGGETYTNSVFFIPVDNKNNIKECLSRICNIPIVDAQKYTLEKGDILKFNIFGKEKCDVKITSPANEEMRMGDVLHQTGLYNVHIKSPSGKESDAYFYVRKPWDFYLESAAENTFLHPQKATTHVEGFYGLFSAFLYYKHSKNEKIYSKAMEVFNEIMPFMFDFGKCVPVVIPERIQNTALLISLLVDIYEAKPEENKKFLEYASRFADFIMSHQTADGAYRSNKTHYTCVIYIAKSMLELAMCEEKSDDLKIREKSSVHFESAKNSIDELAYHLDNIETEGEMTFEDGMISCSALQLAMLALKTEPTERNKYTEAAQYMIKLHSCLEQQLVPDCRMNGASLRYWEAQYDVMIRVNMINSPHGWTAWTCYAYYYLYMLTGKLEYLLSLMNSIGACSQLVDEEGNLRWSFCPQPYIKGESLVPDTTKEVKDGFNFVDLPKKAYRGKYEVREYGEQYINMISSWYRHGDTKPCGGYEFCPLFLGNEKSWVDNQGGCCDNDVHEIFKCIEETVLHKAFIYENDDGTFIKYGCRAESDGNTLNITMHGNENVLSYNLKNEYNILINNQNYNCNHFGLINL